MAGHSVTALTRSPEKLGLQHLSLKIIHGDIQEGEVVEQAVAGVEAVISALGPTQNRPAFEISKGMENILAAMKTCGVRRLVISVGAGVGDPNDSPTPISRLMVVLLKLFSRWVYEDMLRTVDLVRASHLDWIIVRVPMLTAEPKSGEVRVGWVGKGVGARLARADLAEFMLRQIDADAYFRQAPAISN